MSRFALSLLVFLWSGLAFAESAPLDMLLSSSLARQFGQPAELGSESEARLQEFIGKTMESVSCGPRACAEWEADGADLFMALAAVRALESRGKGGIQLEARTTWLASALYLSLEGAREPPRGAGERFPEEKKWSLAVAKARGEKVLGSVPAHVETLRALAWAERARGDQQGPFGARLEAREADGMITWGEAKAKEEYTAHFDRLMAALKGGDPDGALDALDWMSGWLAEPGETYFGRYRPGWSERLLMFYRLFAGWRGETRRPPRPCATRGRQWDFSSPSGLA